MAKKLKNLLSQYTEVFKNNEGSYAPLTNQQINLSQEHFLESLVKLMNSASSSKNLDSTQIARGAYTALVNTCNGEVENNYLFIEKLAKLGLYPWGIKDATYDVKKMLSDVLCRIVTGSESLLEEHKGSLNELATEVNELAFDLKAENPEAQEVIDDMISVALDNIAGAASLSQFNPNETAHDYSF